MPLANLLKLVGDGAQIQTLPGRRIAVFKHGADHHRTAILGDNPADPIGFPYVDANLLKLLRQALEIRRNDIPPSKAFFDHFVVANIGRKERCDRAALDPFNEKYLFRDFPKQREGFRCVDITLCGCNRHQDTVCPSEDILILEKNLHEGVVQRNHFGERCICPKLCCGAGEHYGDQQKKADQKLSIANQLVGKAANPPGPKVVRRWIKRLHQRVPVAGRCEAPASDSNDLRPAFPAIHSLPSEDSIRSERLASQRFSSRKC